MNFQKELYLITKSFNDKYLKVIKESFIRYDNLSMIQLRDKSASLSQTEEFIKQILLITDKLNGKRSKKIKIILNSYNNFYKEISEIKKDYLVNIYNLDGIQESLFNTDLKKTTSRFKGKYNILSCHSKEDVLVAQKLNFDLATLSPIFKTNSHPNETRLVGISNLRNIAEEVDFPIYALGGIDFENMKNLDHIFKVKGYAMINAFFKN